MTTLDEYSELAVWRACIFGRAKIGKTALALQLAKIWKLHWFDLEDGVKTALQPHILAPEYRKNVNVFRIPGKQIAPMGVETLLKVTKGGECKICWLHGKVSCPACSKDPNARINSIDINKLGANDCLVIDSSTQLTSETNAAVLGQILSKVDTPEGFVLDKDTGGKDFKYPAATTFILDRIFSTLQTAHFNSIVISHEVMTDRLKDTEPAGKGEKQATDGFDIVFPAAGSRNYSRNFGRFFDILIHLDIVNKTHRANSSTRYSSNVQTGSRAGNIEDMVGADGKTPLPPFEAIVKLFERKK